jgi:hypothetical protein
LRSRNFLAPSPTLGRQDDDSGGSPPPPVVPLSNLSATAVRAYRPSTSSDRNAPERSRRTAQARHRGWPGREACPRHQHPLPPIRKPAPETSPTPARATGRSRRRLNFLTIELETATSGVTGHGFSSKINDELTFLGAHVCQPNCLLRRAFGQNRAWIRVEVQHRCLLNRTPIKNRPPTGNRCHIRARDRNARLSRLIVVVPEGLAPLLP